MPKSRVNILFSLMITWRQEVRVPTGSGHRQRHQATLSNDLSYSPMDGSLSATQLTTSTLGEEKMEWGKSKLFTLKLPVYTQWGRSLFMRNVRRRRALLVYDLKKDR